MEGSKEAAFFDFTQELILLYNYSILTGVLPGLPRISPQADFPNSCKEIVVGGENGGSFCEDSCPYRYEQPLYLMGWGWIYPDFRVLNVRLRKEMIWEHFGKMDDEEYSRKNLRKLDYYQRNGWFPGENFIMTMETKAKPLSNLEIERIARHYLL